jgi:polysaccharide deacetylase
MSRLLPIIDRFVSVCGIHRLQVRRLKASTVVLMYHKVLPDEIAEDYPLGNLVVRESDFAQQVGWLARYTSVLTIKDALDGDLQRGGRALPTVCISFDDGYKDNRTVAAKHLSEFGLNATFFVSTDFVQGEHLWFDRAARSFLAAAPRLTSEFRSKGKLSGGGSLGLPGLDEASKFRHQGRGDQ